MHMILFHAQEALGVWQVCHTFQCMFTTFLYKAVTRYNAISRASIVSQASLRAVDRRRPDEPSLGGSQ